MARAGSPLKHAGHIVGTSIKPKLGFRPEPFAAAAQPFWLVGDFIKNNEPQGNQVFCPTYKVDPLVYDAMKRAQDESGQAKLSSANLTTDDPYEMCVRADFILESFGPDADKAAFQVDGFAAGQDFMPAGCFWHTVIDNIARLPEQMPKRFMALTR